MKEMTIEQHLSRREEGSERESARVGDVFVLPLAVYWYNQPNWLVVLIGIN